jgi:hypothetical protein
LFLLLSDIDPSSVSSGTKRLLNDVALLRLILIMLLQLVVLMTVVKLLLAQYDT